MEEKWEMNCLINPIHNVHITPIFTYFPFPFEICNYMRTEREPEHTLPYCMEEKFDGSNQIIA